MHIYATSQSVSVCSHNDSSSSLVYASRVFLLSATACVSSVATNAPLSWGLAQEGSAVTEWEGISSFPMINLQQETEDRVCKCDQDTVTAQVRTRTTYFNAENAKPFRPSLLLQHQTHKLTPQQSIKHTPSWKMIHVVTVKICLVCNSDLKKNM